MTAFTLYADPISGNCQKVQWTADYLGLDYDLRPIDILKGEARAEDFLAVNPFGQTPCVVFADGRSLAQSNAIVLHLAEEAGSDLLPADSRQRARVYEWMFFEQNSHEPYVAGRRFRKAYKGQSDDKIDAEWLPRGDAALARLDAALSNGAYLVGETLTAADIVLTPYTRMAAEGGFSLLPFPNLRAWISRVEEALGLEPYVPSLRGAA